MPSLDEAEIKARIADGAFAGITLDTSIFDRYGCNLTFPLLTSLSQFKGGAVRVVFSDVVIGEVGRHIAKEAGETQVKLRAALRDHQKRWKIDLEIADFVSRATDGKDAQSAATAQIDLFVAGVGGLIVRASDAPGALETVLGRYFREETPFEKSEAKKSEFPDAFALVSLERAFPSAQRMLLCVSGDKGWVAYARESASLVVIDKLDVALSYFNEAGRHVVDNIIQKLSSGTAPELASEIELTIQARLDDLDFTPDCSSHIDYESEPESATFKSAHFQSVAEIRIVASDADSVTFTLSIDADIDFGAHFNFHAYDSIDKDYVTLSSEYAERTQAITIKLIIAAQRIVDPEPVTISVEAFLPTYYSVDFGYIEPFPDEDPTHEKY